MTLADRALRTRGWGPGDRRSAGENVTRYFQDVRPRARMRTTPRSARRAPGAPFCRSPLRPAARLAHSAPRGPLNPETGPAPGTTWPVTSGEGSADPTSGGSDRETGSGKAWRVAERTTFPRMPRAAHPLLLPAPPGVRVPAGGARSGRREPLE